MLYIKINDVLYPADVISKEIDKNWDYRPSKEIFLEMSIRDADEIFEDGMFWSIIEDPHLNEDGEVERLETDCSDFCIVGQITDFRDGRISVKMGKLTGEELLNIITEGYLE